MKKSPVVKYMIWSTVLFVVVVLFLKHDNVVRWIGAEITIRKQKKQVEWYQKEISKLDAQIKDMSTDRDSLETFARETYRFAEPGEDVYIVP